MSEKGDGSVLELNSGELEGENNAASKFKCNLTSDNIPLIMGLNPEYSNNGGTSAGNLGLNLLQNFDLENNLLHCDISGVFEWIRHRTDSVSSADLDCMRIDCNEAVVTTSGLTSPNEEPVGVGDLEGAVQTESTFSNSVSSSHNHNDTLNSTLLDELTCLQADDHLIKEEGLINESVFQYSPHQKDEPKLHLSATSEVKNEFSSEGANISDNSTNEVLVSEKCSKVSVFKNTVSLPYVKIPKKCILSGKIIKKDAYSLITKNILSNQHCTEVNQGVQSSQSSVIEAVPLTTYATESLCENGFENNDEIRLMLTEDRFKSSFIDEALQENENDNLVSSADNQEKSSAKTVVAISTNKLEDVTEIIIKTETGEALYKGKGSDILMASNSAPNLLLKFDSNVKDKQKLLPQTADKNDNSDNAVEETAMVVSEDTKTDDPATSVEDEPITEALKALGIANEQWDSYKVIKGHQCVWFCPLENCDCLFNKLSSLKIHILTHYKLRPFKCDFTGCEWSFYTNFRLKRHKETHLGKKEFKCPFETCNRSFTTVYNLHTHLKLHERPADLLCPVSGCGQAFQTRRNMESHLKEHGTEHAPYVCDYIGCEKRYYSTSALQSHSKTHSHNIEDLRCEYCFKMFDKPCRLKAHLRSHTGVKPYKCNYDGCDWAFTTSSKLNRHQAKHTQERRFSCSLCSKAFLRSEHLKDHTLKHFLTRAFVCPISGCNQQFSAKSSLYVHVKKHRKKENENTEESGGHLTKETDLLSVLSDASRLTCPVEECKYFFSSKDEVTSHMQTCHKNIRIELKAQVKDLNALDTIELMNGEDNLISLESLNFKDPSSVTGLNLANLGTDGIVVSLPEYITSTDELTGLSVLNTTSGQIEFSENVQSNSSKDISSCDIPLSSIQTITALPTDIGSARTGLTYQDALAERELRKSFSKRPTVGRKRVSVNPESLLKENNAMQVTSDIVLTAGLLGGSQENLSRGLMFQDDLVGSSDLYSCIAEETGLNDSSAPGEFFQVFILESPGVKNCDFEQSTINLRDLE